MTNSFIKTDLFKFLLKAIGFMAILISLFGMFSISAQAQTAECEGDFRVAEVKWWNVATPGTFLPIIPESCALNDDGTPQALPLTLLPALFIRAYGLIVALAFYLITPVLIGSGLMYMYGGIDQSQVANAKKWLINSFTGLIMIISFYFIVFLLLSFLDPEGVLTGTDLSNFII
jgi:hypothetical protein